MTVARAGLSSVRLLFVVALASMASSTAGAILTPINYPAGHTEPFLDQQNGPHLAILEYLYGAGNFARIDDGWDQIWWEYDGLAQARAKYAGHAHDIGYTQGSSGGTTVWTPTSGYGYGVTGSFTFDFTPNDYLRFNFKDVNTGDTWSSLQSENTQDSGNDHMVTFLITGGASAGHYAIAWEDLRLGQSDRDYNDMVIELEQVMPVPEAGSLVLLGLGILGAAGLWAARRRR